MLFSVGFIGYGAFGRALGELFAEAGMQVLAYDPHAEVPPSPNAGSVAAVVGSSRFVIVAVPISQVRSALTAIRPHLTPSQVVLDVCSVKLGPSGEMGAVLGGEIPWVASHPLFGPTSLALGERPLHVVVCPNPLHPRAVEEVRALYERAGCTVIAQDAESHDRSMAYSHALTYFIARGLFEIGVTEAVQVAPPSFRSLTRAVAAVRSDAGHLVSAVQRENPFSRLARRRLLEALTEIDHKLELPESAEPQHQEDLALPSLARERDLDETRDLIDAVDRELLALLARRSALSRRAFLSKTAAGRAIVDPVREAQLLADRSSRAQAMKLAPQFIEELFAVILRNSRAIQEQLLAAGGDSAVETTETEAKS